MPTWALTCSDGVKRSFDVKDFRKNKQGVVLAFIAKWDTETDTYVLAPGHRHKEVAKLVHGKLSEVLSDSAAAGVGFGFGSAKGMAGALGGAAIGIVVAEVAQHVIDEFFGDEVIDDGKYYASDGTVAFKTLITLS